MRYNSTIMGDYGCRVVDVLYDIISESSKREHVHRVARRRIASGSSLNADLGLDSLDHYELLLTLTERFGIPLPACDEQERILTVDDAVRYVENAKKEAAQAATA